MAVADLYEPILTATLATIQGLGLAGIDTANIQGLEMPVERTGISATPPLILIAPSEEAEDVRPFGMGPQSAFDVTHWVDIVIVQSDQQSYAKNRSQVLGWLSAIQIPFQAPVPTGFPASCWDSEIRPWKAFDRTRLARGYIYSGISVGLHATRARS